MEESKDIKQIAFALLSSGKIRVDGERLESMVKDKSSVDNLLILISDVETFIQSVEASPAFSEMRIVVSEVGFEMSDSPDSDLIVIYKNELPGPVVRLIAKWLQLIEVISWESVEQVEEITTYSLFR